MMSPGSVPRRLPFRVLALTTTAVLCFAANSILCRLALAPRLIDAATYTTVRVFSAAAMFSLVIGLQRRRLPRPTRADAFSAAALLVYLVFFSFAYVRLDAGSGALILVGAVQLTMFSIALCEGERFLLSQWAGMGMALFGFVYLVLPGARAPDPLGAAFMTMSGVGWGSFSLLARGTRDPIAANAGNFLWCLLPTFIVGLLGGQGGGAMPEGLLLAAISGAIATGCGYIVWYLALRDLPALHAATVQLTMPALVAFGGVAFLSEPLTMRLLIASAAMLGGIALVLAQRVQRSTS
jgi:drug/metabolite transporter (DMT)-like permease